ncbi:hypothetical protein PSOS111911_13040 [Pseudoalteromonas ostreae]
MSKFTPCYHSIYLSLQMVSNLTRLVLDDKYTSLSTYRPLTLLKMQAGYYKYTHCYYLTGN